MGRRVAVLLAVLLVLGAPAAVLRAGCAGASCRSSSAIGAPAPFCSLPADLRALITAGTYDGRSPDAMAVAATTPVLSDVDDVAIPWPSAQEAERSSAAVPLVFLGRDVRDRTLPSTLTLDQVAPTIAPLLGLVRPHPEVRSGTPIQGVVRPRARSPLVVLIVWKGVGLRDGGRTPWLDAEQPGNRHESHVAAGVATAGSLPLDPVAVETTIGTGGVPAQHGITGTRVRGSNGRVVTAYGPGAPAPVIAALGDDLDLATGGTARIGLVGDAPGDAGLTGARWYGTGPIADRSQRATDDPASDVHGFLTRGWGSSGAPDLLAVALDGSATRDDRATAAIAADVLRTVPDATVVVTATGSLRAPGAVHAAAPDPGTTLAAGGAFLDRAGDDAASSSDAIDAFRAQTAPDGTPLFADAFASYAVRFGRYC